MARGKTTKDKIQELGEALIRTRGYSAFSYHDISSKLKIKNAAIHYHYAGKEDLGIAILQQSNLGFDVMIEEMKVRELNEWEQLNIFIDAVFSPLAEQNKVCLVGALSAEYAVLPSRMKKEYDHMVDIIEKWLTELLKEGRKKKIFSFTTTPHTKALMIITNMIAGLQIARISSKENFFRIKEGIFQELKP